MNGARDSPNVTGSVIKGIGNNPLYIGSDLTRIF